MSDLIDLLETEFFRVGLRIGLGSLALAWLLSLFFRSRVRPLPIAGILIAVGTTLALLMLDQELGSELVGLLLVVGGALVGRAFKTAWATPLAVVPGALWLASTTTVSGLTWVRAALLVLIPLGGYLITDFEQRYEGLGLGVVFYVLAVLGVFVAVPDTEWARTLVAVSVPIVFVAWPKPVARLGPEGAYACVAILILVAAQGGSPRPASVVGSIACLGLLLIEPVLIAFRPEVAILTTWPRHNWAGAVVASLPQFVVVLVCSRVAARFESELPALMVVALVYGVTIAAGLSAASSGQLSSKAS